MRMDWFTLAGTDSATFLYTYMRMFCYVCIFIKQTYSL